MCLLLWANREESMTVMKDSYLQVCVDALQARVKSPESKCCFITVSIYKR